jgi:hypothetical protein
VDSSPEVRNVKVQRERSAPVVDIDAHGEEEGGSIRGECSSVLLLLGERVQQVLLLELVELMFVLLDRINLIRRDALGVRLQAAL